MRIILKILAAPFVLILTILVAFLSFVCAYGGWLLNIIAVIGVILSIALFIIGQKLGGGVFLFLAFLLSPFGIPAIAEWLVDKLDDLNDSLKSFITD